MFYQKIAFDEKGLVSCVHEEDEDYGHSEGVCLSREEKGFEELLQRVVSEQSLDKLIDLKRKGEKDPLLNEIVDIYLVRMARKIVDNTPVEMQLFLFETLAMKLLEQYSIKTLVDGVEKSLELKKKNDLEEEEKRKKKEAKAKRARRDTARTYVEKHTWFG